MSDKSFGDPANRNVVKNPLLSTSVVGLSLQDLSSNAVLLPVAQSPALISSQGHQPQDPHAGDNQHTATTPTQPNTHKHTQKHIPPPTRKSADDFDVTEYFARLQGTRYVSAPINVHKELEKTALEKAEENLEEINLNELPAQQSITSDIAQNFSQLPQVLPQVASAVFTSFSNMLSYKSREATPDADVKMADDFKDVQFERPADVGDLQPKEVAPPPKDFCGNNQNTFRITTKKKSYAQIPGLSSGETVPMSLHSQPTQAHTSSPFYVPGFEPGQPNPAQTITHLPGFGLGQPASVVAPGSQSGQSVSQREQMPALQSDQCQPTRETGFYNQGNIANIGVTDQMHGDPYGPVQGLVENKASSEEFAPETFGTNRVEAETFVTDSRKEHKETEHKIADTTPAFKPTHKTDDNPQQIEGTKAFKHEEFQSVQMFTPPQPNSSQDTAYDTCKKQPQISSSFSNIPGFTGPQSTAIIPPPTMFSNQRIESKTDVGKTILPPSVARRLAGNQPLIQTPANMPGFAASIFVPATVGDQITQDNSTAVSNFPPPRRDIPPMPTQFSRPPMSSQASGTQPTNAHFSENIPSSLPPSYVWPAPPPSFATSLSQNVSPMPPPPMFVNPTTAAEPAMSANIFTPSNPPESSASNVFQAPPMFDATAYATNPSEQQVAQEKPKSTFEQTAFTTHPPEPPKVVPSTNFRLSKKRPKYYSGPIEGVGSISNNVKPIIPQADVPGAYQGALFKPAIIPEVEPSEGVSQPFMSSAVSLEASTVPFDLSKPLENTGPNYQYITEQQQNMIREQINTAFDFSRQTTQSFDEPKQENKGVGLIGSLKSKLSSLDINKIHNSVTTFFDPAYNDGVKTEPDISNSGLSQNYGHASQNYGQSSESRQNFGHDQQTNLEIYIPNSQQMPEQLFNQQCYDSTYNQCQNSNINVHGLQANNQYFPEHYNYYQYPTQNPTNQQSYYTVHPSQPFTQQESVAVPQSSEQIQETNATNVYNSNLYNFNRMSEDVTSKDFFDTQHHTNVNQYCPDEVRNMTKNQAEAQVVSDKLLQSQTVGFQGALPQPIVDESARLQVGANVSNVDDITDNVTSIIPQVKPAVSRNTTNENAFMQQHFGATEKFDNDKTTAIADEIQKKEEETSFTNTSGSQEREPAIDISKAHLIGLSSSLADNYKEVEEKLEDLTLKEQSALKFENSSSFFFDNIDQDKEQNERKSEEDITDLKMCETCREVNSPDSSKTDLTTQLIQNITAPIQLSNPVEVPFTESEPPLLDNLQFVSNPCAEISLVTEETIEAIQIKLATELLDQKDIEKFEKRPEIREVTSYGWCDSRNDLNDPNIQNIGAIQDYTFHTDPNAIGFVSNNSLFFDNIPTNASDEIKAEFKCAHEEPIRLSRQMSIPTAPAEEDLETTTFDLSGGLDVQLIEQDAKRDFPVFEEFVIEPSETDDDKVKEKERSGSEEEVNETDTFTNRVERFKKLEDSVEPSVSSVLFEVPTSASPSVTIASYFDTGNYAAETHYRKSLTSPSSINSAELSAQNICLIPPSIPSCKVQDSLNNPLFSEVDKSIYKIPDVGTQTTVATTTTTQGVYSYTTTTAFTPSPFPPEGMFHSHVSQSSAKETLPAVNIFENQATPQENVFQTLGTVENIAEAKKEPAPLTNEPKEVPRKTNVAQNLPDPMNFFASEKTDKKTDSDSTNRLASYFASPAKTADNTKSFFELSQGQNHLKEKISKNWETTQSYKSFFEENLAEDGSSQQDFTDASLRQKQENTRQQRQSLGREEQEDSNQHQNWESTQSFKSYFDTEEDRNTANEDESKNKTLYEMTQSQNVTYTPDQYRANIQLMKDLTSSSNYKPTEEQVVKTVNYNTVFCANRTFKTDLSTGEPEPKINNDKLPLNEKLKTAHVNNDIDEIVPDDSKLETVVNKCKYCCDKNSDRIVEIKDADLNTCKIRTAMDGNTTESKQDTNMSPEKHSDVVTNAPLSVPSSYNVVKYDDNKEDSNATLSDGRLSTEYVPVKHHWFYRVDTEGKSIWRGFSVTDNSALEEAFHSPELDESTVVPTDGGRFDVNVLGRLRVAVYWADKPTNVRRCSWFYKGTTDARYVPYTEAVADKLEEEYRHGVTTGEWHRRLVLPNNEAVVMHGPAVMVHFLQSSAADAWSGGAYFQFGKRVYRNPPKVKVAKDQVGRIDHLLLLVHGAGEWTSQKEKIQSTMRPRVVRRGYDESEIEDPEPSSIDHLLLLCHGVGSACDMRFRSVEEVVDDFRATSLQLIQSHYRSSYDEGIVGRVEVLPISWHSTLHSGEGGVDRRLARITLDSIPRLRSFTNDTVLDVLFYTSPVFCQTIIDEVCKELNRIYALFKQRNPHFEGGVSLGGHSLGSVILYDLLCHQQAKSSSASTSNKAEKVVTGSAGTGQPTVRYPALHFTPQALYALGSPIAIFECIRGVDCLGEQFALPDCKNFFNIFHPYDPIAYRIEPLLNPQLKNVPPFLIPHHKGRKRMHLELKETVARVGADIKQKLIESIKTTWSSMWRTQPPSTGELEKVVEEELEKEALADAAETSAEEPEHIDVDTQQLLGQLNAGRRVDYVLQEAPFEMINEYLFAMSSHVCYWESEDTMLLMLREIYDKMGVQPDCCLPQQTMAVQRTRTAGTNDDILANAEMASTSGAKLEK